VKIKDKILFAPLLASLAVAGFVGGANFSMLIAMGWLIANELRLRGTKPYMAVLQGHLLSITYVFSLGVVVIPILRNIPTINQFFFFRMALPSPEYARSYVYTELVEQRQLLSIVLSGLPIFCYSAVLVKRKRRERRSITNIESSNDAKTRRSRRVLIAPYLVSMAPLVVAAQKKLANPLEYVVATMSGDGRNFFLIVENIRVTARPTSLFQILGQGDFLPSLAAHLSTGLGASGRLDFRDQYAIAAIYSYMSVIIMSSLAAYVMQILHSQFSRDEDSTRGDLLGWVLAPALIVSGFLLLNFGPITNEIFRSGFFSLYGAFAFLVAYLAVSLTTNTTQRLLLQFITLVSLSVVYPLVIGLVILGFGIQLVVSLKKVLTPRHAALLVTVSFLILRITEPWGPVLKTLQQRLTLDGAIIPLDPDMLTFVLAVASVGYLATRVTEMGTVFRDLALVAVGGYLLRYIIIDQRTSAGLEGAGYYGAKNDYAIAFVVLFLTVALVLFLLGNLLCRAEPGQSQKRFASRGLICVISLVWAFNLAGIVSGFARPQTLLSRRADWIQPRASSIEFAISTWGKGDYLYLSSDDPGEARLLNFWMPYTWRSPGWNWVYFDASSSPETICELMREAPAHLVADTEVTDGINDRCGELLVDH